MGNYLFGKNLRIMPLKIEIYINYTIKTHLNPKNRSNISKKTSNQKKTTIFIIQQNYIIKHMQFQIIRKIKNKKIISLFIILTLLLTIPFSIAQTNRINNEEKQHHSVIKPKKIIPLPEQQIKKLKTNTENFFSNTTSILPKNPFIIQKNPEIATKNKKILALAETQKLNYSQGQLTATYSTNNGKAWQEQMTISLGNTSFKNPSLDYTGDQEMQVYGSHRIDSKTGIQLFFGFPNITNPNTKYKGSTQDFDMNGWFNGRILSWDKSYWTQIGNPSTAGYPHGTKIGPYKNFHGLTIWPGNDGNGWSYYFFCETDETSEQPYKILWKNYMNGTIENVDIDIDLGTGWQYDLCEIINETTNKPEIQIDMLYLEPGNPEWYNKESNYGPSHIFKNYENPKIKASNGYIYIVCEKNEDIYLHYSKDKGYTYSTRQITDTEEKEKKPQVTADGNSVAVTYVKQNKIHLTTSTNGGKNWKSPIIVNQEENVSDKTDAIDIDKNSIVWTDKRENSTVYFDNIELKTPILEINNITGGTKISADIQNKGTIDAENIPYKININDGILFSKRQITGNITIPANKTVTIQTNSLILGFGRPTIKIQVGSTTKSIPSILMFFYVKI
ncbi:MAG: hypothetical protein V5A68_06565 [Candidatus Thermoplasmatota archaeon]